MENRFNLVPKLSLNEMALRRVVVNLWYEYDILVATLKLGKFDKITETISGIEWQKIIDKVKEKVLKLVLPESLKEKTMHLVRLVGREILRWKLFHECILNYPCGRLDILILEQLCWTCAGAVDYRKTAEELVRLEMLDIEKRYRLACWYCLEDYIPVLWVELPEEYKGRFNDEVYPLPDNVYLEYYWASILKGEEFKTKNILPREFVNVSSTYQSFFEYSVCKDNKAATEYFYQKLTIEERGNALFRTLCDALERGPRSYLNHEKDEKPRSDVLFYLLSLMTHEQQMQVFKKHPSSSLMLFRDWPWQDLMDNTIDDLNIIDFIWIFVPDHEYDRVLDRMMVLRLDYYFPDVFQKLFVWSPSGFKRRFVHCELLNGGNLSCLSQFIHFEDAETIKVVLENLDAGDRMKLLSTYRFFFLLYYVFMRRDKWNLVELCVGEAMLSKEDREILKEAYMGFHTELRRELKGPHTAWIYIDYDKYNWKRLFDILDGTSASTNIKKCSEDETVIKAKRLPSEEEKYDLTKKLKTLK